MRWEDGFHKLSANGFRGGAGRGGVARRGLGGVGEVDAEGAAPWEVDDAVDGADVLKELLKNRRVDPLRALRHEEHQILHLPAVLPTG